MQFNTKLLYKKRNLNIKSNTKYRLLNTELPQFFSLSKFFGPPLKDNFRVSSFKFKVQLFFLVDLFSYFFQDYGFGNRVINSQLIDSDSFFRNRLL